LKALASTHATWPHSLPLDEVVADYLEALRAAGRSPRTIEWYGAFLAEFLQFAVRSSGQVTLEQLTPPAVRRWLVALQARPRPPAPASLAGRVRTLKAFGAWVASEYDLEVHPLRGVSTPRVPQVLVRSLKESDVVTLLETAEARSRSPERDTAIILLIVDTGLRVSEVVRLNIADVDFEVGRCRVFGKGAKERLVPIGRRARRALRRSIAARRQPAPDAPLFLGRDGQRLTVGGLQKLIRRLARACLDARCSPHVLRHTFARSFLTNGGAVFSLQRILGHSPTSLDVTRRYVQLLDEDLREAHRRASPVDRLSASASGRLAAGLGQSVRRAGAVPRS
jgi:site-specific recombinase XerD